MREQLQNSSAKRLSARERTRTCVSCGKRQDAADDASWLLRLVAAGGVVAFDLAGGAFGRGLYVHATPECLGRAPRGVARVLSRKRSGAVGASEAPGPSPMAAVTAEGLGLQLALACDSRIAGLLLAARRLRAVAIGADAARAALAFRRESEGSAPAFTLAVVATDAGSVALSTEVVRAAEAGRAIAWGTKNDLGALLGERAVAICTVRHPSIAAELRKSRALADVGNAVKREGAECSRRPEAR